MKKQRKTEIRILSSYDASDKVLSILLEEDFSVIASENINSSFNFKRVDGENANLKSLSHLKSIAKYANWDYTEITDAATLQSDFDGIIDNMYKKYKSFKKNKQMLEAQREQCVEGKNRFRLFGDLPVDFQEVAECEFIDVRFGHMPKACLEKLNAIYDGDPYFNFFITFEDKTDYWGMYFVPQKMTDRIDSIFASLLFEPVAIPSASGNAKDVEREIDSNISILEQELKETDDLEKEFFKNEYNIANTLYYLIEREYRKFEIKSACSENGGSLMIDGSIRKENADKVIDEIQKMPGAFAIRIKDFKIKTA